MDHIILVHPQKKNQLIFIRPEQIGKKFYFVVQWEEFNVETQDNEPVAPESRVAPEDFSEFWNKKLADGFKLSTLESAVQSEELTEYDRDDKMD